MTPNPKTRHTQCPKCDTRLAVADDNRSPFIRCGKCQTLFKFSVDPIEVSQADDIQIVKTNIETSNRFGQVYGPSETPESSGIPVLTHNPETNRFPKFWLVLGAVIVFFFINMQFWDGVKSKRRRAAAKQQSFRVDQIRKLVPTVEKRVFDKSLINAWVTGNGFPRKQIDLADILPNAYSAIPADVDCLIMDGLEIPDTAWITFRRFFRLRKIQISGMEITYEIQKFLKNQFFIVIDLHGSQLSEGDVPKFRFSSAKFRYLGSLDLTETDVTGYEIRRIDSCRHLQVLKLRNTKINDAGIQPVLRHPSLRVLDLVGTEVTMKSLDDMRCPQLKMLKLSADRFTLDEIEKLRTLYPDLTVQLF